MNRGITFAEIGEINTIERPGCISMYVPPSVDITGNPTRIKIKNMLHEAKLALAGMGVDKKDIARVEERVMQYLDEYEIRPVRSECVVLFVNPDFLRYFHIPNLHLHMLMIGTRFNTSPIVSLLAGNRQFYLLSLAHKHVQLYLGDRFSLKPLDVKGLNYGMRETLRIDEFPTSRETHPIAPAYLGKGSRSYHQQYDVTITDKDMLNAFFRRVNEAVMGYIGITRTPLILAGTERIVSAYKKANTYPYLLQQAVGGNQEKSSMNILRDKALHVLYG